MTDISGLLNVDAVRGEVLCALVRRLRLKLACKANLKRLDSVVRIVAGV